MKGKRKVTLPKIIQLFLLLDFLIFFNFNQTRSKRLEDAAHAEGATEL